jgi:AraC-like DNA-binding protein
MERRPLVHTSALSQAVPVIHRLVDPFRFSWTRSPVGADIRVTGAQLDRLGVYGVHHGPPVLVRWAPLRYHYIVMPLHGEMIGQVRGVETRVRPGEALFFPAGTCLHAHWSERCVGLVLSIPREEAELAMRRCGLPPGSASSFLPKLTLTNGPGRTFANVLRCLCIECDQEGGTVPGVLDGLQALLLTSLMHMHSHLRGPGLEGTATTRRRRDGVARALEYIEQNPRRAVRISELARAACLSPRSLQAGFAEHFGVGPLTYAKRLRLERARAEIEETAGDVAIANIAHRWGFGSADTFTRLYQRQFGELPSQTRARSRRAAARAAH